jgi:adenylate cyclase
VAPVTTPAPRRRYTIRLTLGTAIVGLLVLTVGGIVLAWTAIRSGSRNRTAEAIASEVSRGVADDVRGRKAAAEASLLELVSDATHGSVPIDDLEALAERLVERMRYEPRFEWITYRTAAGAGAHVLRQSDGTLLRVTGAAGGPLRHTYVMPDGRRESTTAEATGLIQLPEAPWYEPGSTSAEPVWTTIRDPKSDAATGRACSLGVRREGSAGPLVGVFGVGHSTVFSSAFLSHVWGDRAGFVAVFSPSKRRVGSASSPRAAGDLKHLLDAAADDLPNGRNDLPEKGARIWSLEHLDETWIVALRRLDDSKTSTAAVAIVMPERELVGYFSPWRRYGLAAVGGLLLLGVAAALLVAHRIAKPLRRIAAELDRVASFDIADTALPDSRIKEVAIVGDAASRMKASLRSFGRYVPTDLVRRLLHDGRDAQLGGVLRTLTLFFSDIEGFTKFSEGTPPQALVDALGDYLVAVTGALSRGGGTVDKYVGDGVVAFFNAPQDDTHHAANACRAALGVQAALEAARSGWAAAGRPAFRTRIGLHTADVVVGNIGTPERFAYTVIGDGVNLAARLESLNKAYGTWILASDATRCAAGEGFQWRRLDRISVAGRQSADDVFELLGETGHVPPPVLEARDHHEAGLAAYLARDFASAASSFAAAAALRPDDRASRLLADRSRDFALRPPPPNWDGVEVRTEK